MSKTSKTHFSRSLQIALQMVTAIFNQTAPKINGKEVLYWDKGEELPLPLPEVRNFIFFEDIKPHEIERGKPGQETGMRFVPLKRQIELRGYRGIVLATVWLEGNEFPNQNRSVRFWRVVRIKYRRYYDEGSQHQDPNWFETGFTEKQTPLQ
jgi:hypothetical protein